MNLLIRLMLTAWSQFLPISTGGFRSATSLHRKYLLSLPWNVPRREDVKNFPLLDIFKRKKYSLASGAPLCPA